MNRKDRRRHMATRRRDAISPLVDGPDGLVLADSAAEAVIMAVIHGHDPEPVAEEDLVLAVDEVTRMVLGGVVADLVLSGRVRIRVQGGELVFVYPTASLSGGGA